jgi:hypothetical protein
MIENQESGVRNQVQVDCNFALIPDSRFLIPDSVAFYFGF